MRIRLLLSCASALALFASTAASTAAADDKQVCADAYEKSQVLRDDGKLLQSRDQLRLCARAECAAAIAKTCADWLAEVEQRIPSVVLSAKSGAGVELTDVRVTMDGAEITKRLQGRAVDVDPGVHTFVFEAPDGKTEQKLVVKQGTKDQALAVTIGAAPPPPRMEPALPPPAMAEERTSTLRYVGYAVGGLGIVGVGLGVVFGLSANSKFDESTKDPNNTGCDANDVCGAQGKQARSDAQSAGTLATVGFVAGGVLLATGVALVVFAPSKKSNIEGARLTPMVGANAGGLMLGGRFF